MTLAAAALLGTGAAQADGRTEQWWTELAHEIPAGPGGVLATAGAARVAEGFDVVLWNAEANLFFEAGKRFAWGPGLKYQETRDSGGAFERERRYLLTGRAKFGPAAGAWKSDLRGIFEYRDREGRDPTWRLRLRPGVKRPLGRERWTFVGQDEIFYDSAQDRIDQNRARIGGERPLRARARTTVFVYYLLRSDRRGDSWEKTHVLGSAWTF